MAAKVFLCYRRDDSAAFAGRVQDRLAQEFGRELLFMDVDAIPLGMNFVTALHEAVAKCEVLLAVIGPNWLEARDEAGARRLDDPNDFVRIEIGAALQRNIPVIPILLDGAKVPKANQLPEDLKELARRNALDVRHGSFHSDLDKLVRGLKAQLDQDDVANRRAEQVGHRQDELRRDLEGKSAAELQPSRRIGRPLRFEFAEQEGQHRTQSEQGPQPPVKPWVLPLVGACVASLPAVLLFAQGDLLAFIALIVNALYGGAAGTLVQQFGILRAVTIPIIPAGLLGILLVAAIGPFLNKGVVFMDPRWFPLDAALCLVGAAIAVWLVFWSYSKWGRMLAPPP
jgi:hypothetical protein